jgi:hypothetical protein
MLLRVPAPCRSHCSWNIALWAATLATLRSLIARLRHATVIAFFLLLSLMGSNLAFASWFTNFGGQMAGTASVKSTATDASGNVYAVDQTNAVSLNLGGLATRQVGKNTDAFVVKRAPDGTVLWIKRLGGNAASMTVTAYHVKVDASGNVYVVGTFSGGSMTEPALTKIGNEDTFGRLLARSNSNQPTIRRQTQAGPGDYLPAGSAPLA